MNENALLIIIGFFLVIYFPGLIAIGILGFFIYAFINVVGFPTAAVIFGIIVVLRLIYNFLD
jgi:hypothetical protein